MSVQQSKTVTLGLVQMRCQPELAVNLENAIAHIRKAAKAGAQIICLPELFCAQYFCQRQDPAIFDVAEPVPGPTTEALARVARDTNTVLVASILERRAAGVYHHTAAVLDSNVTLLALHPKMHIPDDPLYFEQYYFSPVHLALCV